jgi:glyoxylase-like metal-dependent hydrolase (beta-lactamase superfamily II)
MGEHANSDCIDHRVKHRDKITIGDIELITLYTPGHTIESCSFFMTDRIFTGDLLLYRSTGRTDFQNGDAGQSWDSIQKEIFVFPDNTLIFAAHDYKGWTISSVGEEKRFNPRLAGKTREEYTEIMHNLNLPHPKMMDVAVPANQACGKIAVTSN